MLKTARGSKEFFSLIIFPILTLLLLGLTAINIKNYTRPKAVLGIGTIDSQSNLDKNNSFWQEFLKSHPDYIPGLLEIGNSSLAGQIDPNWSPQLNK